jgi:phage repressor protein C with HTH and peptisase S24 domain
MSISLLMGKSVHNAHLIVKSKRTPICVQTALMKSPDKSKTQGERLTQARIAAGFEDAKSAATSAGWNYYTYSQHERDERGLRASVAEKYARKFKVKTAWLLVGEGEMTSSHHQEDIPILGYAGGRERIDLIGSDDEAVIDEVAPLRASDGFKAVIIRGTSMLPIYRDGDALFFRQDGEGPERNIGKDCVVITDRDRAYVKRIGKGTKVGLYSLLSYAPGIDPIIDVKIKAAWPIEWIRRK